LIGARHLPKISVLELIDSKFPGMLISRECAILERIELLPSLIGPLHAMRSRLTRQ